MTAETMLDAENAIAKSPASRGISSNWGNDRKVTEALKMTAACNRCSRQPCLDRRLVAITTHHQARTRANHKHRSSAIQPALLIEALVVRPAEEEVRDAEAQAPDNEVERGTEEAWAGAWRALERVRGERFVGAEVRLAPLRDAEEHARDDARLDDERVVGRLVERAEEVHQLLALLRRERRRRGPNRGKNAVWRLSGEWAKGGSESATRTGVRPFECVHGFCLYGRGDRIVRWVTLNESPIAVLHVQPYFGVNDDVHTTQKL